jgi:hypothetical protein
MPSTPNQTPTPHKRVRVTSPRMSPPRRGPVPPVPTDIDEQTRLGELYMTTSMMIGGLPLLFVFVPATRTLDVGPIPLPWLILGVLIYPAVWLAGRYYVRQSEQIEREFTELVARR